MFKKWWKWRKKWERDSISRLHKHKGFTQSWKLCLNLCLLTSLSLNLNLVSNLKPTGLWMLKVGLAVSWPIFNKDFSKDKTNCDLYICLSSLLHSKWFMGKKNIWIHLVYNKMLYHLNRLSIVLMNALWHHIA